MGSRAQSGSAVSSTSFLLKFAGVTSAMLTFSMIFSFASFLFAVLTAPLTGFISGACFSAVCILVLKFLGRKLRGRAVRFRDYFVVAYIPISVLFFLQMQGFFYLDFREPFFFQFAAFIMVGHSMLFAGITTPMVKNLIRRELNTATGDSASQV
jgi:sugar phosphate permease